MNIHLEFSRHRSAGDAVTLRREEILLLKRTQGRGRRITLSGGRYEYENVSSPSHRKPVEGKGIEGLRNESGEIQSEASALSVLRRIGSASDTKQVNQLAEVFEDLRLFDPDVNRARQPAFYRESKNFHLESDAGNLAQILNSFRQHAPDMLAAIENDIRSILPGFQRFEFRIIGGSEETVQVELIEAGLRGASPMARASFGTVRAIALFTMLRDPNPPRLTCLEEIDHGLHPHALEVLVERLREAASRSQIIVATHSPALVNWLDPSELLIFERDSINSSTRIIQLDPAEISKMEDASGYHLGELWFSGTLGGYQREAARAKSTPDYRSVRREQKRHWRVTGVGRGTAA